MRRIVKSAVALVLVLAVVLPSGAPAATCSSPENCANARIQSILVGWDAVNANPYTVKVRFDTLSGLGCNFQGASFNEVVLWSNDPAFDTKYSVLLTAYTLGKPVWFYVKSSSASAVCEFRTVIF